jgi:hypothetical protein
VTDDLVATHFKGPQLMRNAICDARIVKERQFQLITCPLLGVEDELCFFLR